MEKLEKKASKTYNIKVLWQHNYDLSLNSKANIHASQLAESLELTFDKKKNTAYLLFDITQEETETPVLSQQKL